MDSYRLQPDKQPMEESNRSKSTHNMVAVTEDYPAHHWIPARCRCEAGVAADGIFVPLCSAAFVMALCHIIVVRYVLRPDIVQHLVEEPYRGLALLSPCRVDQGDKPCQD